MAFKLPPLNSLRVFEAAARHNSFRQAADELNITASAVSHGMQTLEDWLGVELFFRETRGLRLTPAGEAYLPLISDALAMLAKATEQLPGRKGTGKLVVSSAPTFANRLLLPRLADFTEKHPELQVTLNTSRRFVDLPLDAVDVAIRMATEAASAPYWTELMKEFLVPVCAPKVKAQLQKLDPSKLFGSTPLIHVTTISSGWADWFAKTGIAPPPNLDDGLRVDTVQMAFEAAIQGLGLALGRRPLVDDDLSAGRLVVAVDRTVPSGSSYWFVSAETNFEKPEVKLFRKWLVTQFGQPDAAAKISSMVKRPVSVAPSTVDRAARSANR